MTHGSCHDSVTSLLVNITNWCGPHLQFLNECHGRGSVGHMREITRPQPFQLKTKQVFGHIARARLIPLLKAPITI